MMSTLGVESRALLPIMTGYDTVCRTQTTETTYTMHDILINRGHGTVLAFCLHSDVSGVAGCLLTKQYLAVQTIIGSY